MARIHLIEAVNIETKYLKVGDEGITLTGDFSLINQGEIRIFESGDEYYVGFKASTSLSANQIWILPSTDGAAGTAIKTDGSGNLSWSQDISTTAAVTFARVSVGTTGLTIGDSVPFSDSTGVLTLQNIDAVDSTTTTTIVNAIQDNTIVVADHGTNTTDEVVNVCYSTGATPPTASDTTEGTLYIQHST